MLVSTLCATRMQRSLDEFVNGGGARTIGSNHRPTANSFHHSSQNQTIGGTGRARRGSMTVDIQVETSTQQYGVDFNRAQMGAGGSEEYDLAKVGGNHTKAGYEKGAYAV